jgi:hypothetical protein
VSRYPSGWVCNSVPFSVFDQAKNHDRVVIRGLEAFANKGPASVRPLPADRCQFRKTFAEKPPAMIDRRISARSFSYGYLFCFCLCICFCLWGRF